MPSPAIYLGELGAAAVAGSLLRLGDEAYANPIREMLSASARVAAAGSRRAATPRSNGSK